MLRLFRGFSAPEATSETQRIPCAQSAAAHSEPVLVHVTNWRIHSLMDAMSTKPGNLAAVLS